MHEGFSLELIAVRRILEPAATRLAAEKMNEATIAELEGLLDRLEGAPTEAERIPFDAEFHSLVARRSDNATFASMLAAVSSRTVRARAWDVALEAIGPERLLFGTDWPVCRLVSTYLDVVAATEALVAELTLSERDRIMGDNADRVYRLGVSTVDVHPAAV